MSLLITFEGTDGSGKTTQAHLLAEELRRRGLDVVETREPGGTELGEAVRALILDPASPAATPLAMALLYSASRAQLVETVIRPALGRGAVVIADRYTDSTLAYQGDGLGLDPEAMRVLTRVATGGLTPDITILVDVAPEVGVERAGRRGQLNRLDAGSLAFHRRVRAGYQALAAAEPKRWVTISGEGSPDAIHAAILRQLQPRLRTLEEAS